MSISTVSSSTPVIPVTPVVAGESKTPDKTPGVKTDADANDATAHQPPPKPPLPPGQGTRVDQLA